MIKRITPDAKTSTAAPLYGFFIIYSGAIYPGVPKEVVKFPSFDSIREANPKSAILILNSSSSKIFSGFKSLWQIPESWQYLSASMYYLR